MITLNVEMSLAGQPASFLCKNVTPKILCKTDSKYLQQKWKNTTHLKYPIIQEQQRQANTGFINQEAQPLQRHCMMHHVN